MLQLWLLALVLPLSTALSHAQLTDAGSFLVSKSSQAVEEPGRTICETSSASPLNGSAYGIADLPSS